VPVRNHVHRYIRAIGRLTEANKASGFIGYYRCAEPNCTHYTKAELILGKKSICNRCSKEFILPLSLRNLTNRPHCKDCTRSKGKNPIVDSMKKLEDNDEMQDWIDLADEQSK